jgi:hypothetical protein
MKAAFLAVLTLRIPQVAGLQFTFWLERVSRRFVAVIPHAPAAKFDLVASPRELSLEEALYAARKNALKYEFVPEDEYFRRVEHLLDRALKPGH